MFDNDYLIDLDIDYTTIRHKIAKKVLVSYNSYSKATMKVHDTMNTVYQLMKVKLEKANQAVTNRYSETLEYDLAKLSALTKIIKNVNQLFSETLNTVALSNKSILLNQIYRQILECFSVFMIIIQSSPEISVLYLNHPHILEYDAVKTKEDYIDKDLKRAYQVSVLLFSNFHNIDTKTARKEYSKPYGWAYRQITDEDGEYYNHLNTKKIREYVFRGLYTSEEKETMDLYIKTADMAVHPTPTYLYDLWDIDEGKSKYREVIFTSIIGLYKEMLLLVNSYMTRESTFDLVTKYSIGVLDKIQFEDICEDIVVNDDYDTINKYSKHSMKYQKPYDLVELILQDFNPQNVPLISHHQTLHYEYFSLDNIQKFLYKNLDHLYSLVDSYFENLYYFYPKVVEHSAKLANVRMLYHKISFLYHELAVTYAFQQTTLMQKIYRLMIEFSSILDKIINSSEDINKAFRKLSYVLLENSIYSADYDFEKQKTLLNEIRELLKLPNDLDREKLKDFMSWTSHVNNNGKVVQDSIVDVVKNYIHNSDGVDEIFLIIWKECNPVMHAGGYALEVNNDLYTNKLGAIDYVAILYNISILALNNFSIYTKQYSDKKLDDSVNLITGSLIMLANRFSKKVMKLKDKMNI